MRKGKHVIGQAVFSFADGKKIDTVKDLLISESNDAIVALLVDEGGLLSSSRVVPIESVRGFGRDAVVVESGDAVVPASKDPEVKAILQRKDTLLGKRVATDAGVHQGAISDMYFDDKSGRILGFEVSGGLLGDVARGSSYLPVEEIERLGPDVIFVRPETGQALEGQVGGVQGALSEAGQAIGDAKTKASENLQLDLADRQTEKALIGRRSGMDVTDDNGQIVVANGQLIRAEHVDWAKRSDRIGLLTDAATSGEDADRAARTGAGLQQAGDNLGSMWDRFQVRVSQMRDEQGKQADAQQTANRLAQIQDAIGRPVGKVVLDRSDNVILDFGDIITHQAIQKSFEAGMLDTLLASVYRASISFPPEQLMARQPGSATVAKASGGADLVQELERKVQETDREKAERAERERMEAERAREDRERQRTERAGERQAADEQRAAQLAEAEAAKAELEATDAETKTTSKPKATVSR